LTDSNSPTKMNIDKNTVADFLRGYSLVAEKFSKKEKGQSKTPDFRVHKQNELVFYCEVKSIEQDNFEELVLKHGFYVRTGKNPIDDIISKKIHEAHKQFNTVNRGCNLPNVLVFVNHERTFEWKYGALQRVVAEVVPLSDGTYLQVGNRAIDGRIKTEKFDIHLYIWIDYFRHTEPGFLFSQSNKTHYCNLCKYFRKKPEEIDVSKRKQC